LFWAWRFGCGRIAEGLQLFDGFLKAALLYRHGQADGALDLGTGAVATEILHFPARVVVPTDDLRSANAPHGFKELSGVSERPMIIRMTRHQQRYDHRLRDLVQRAGGSDQTLRLSGHSPTIQAQWWVNSVRPSDLNVTNALLRVE
jgi:hypothetical protein